MSNFEDRQNQYDDDACHRQNTRDANAGARNLLFPERSTAIMVPDGTGAKTPDASEVEESEIREFAYGLIQSLI